ncbi:MAG TPA: DUF6191 domain-containing protein [Jatrophihabitans sp.]|uniref:DUF6191 domain-containing protein n=1 Tax=Jatrophihabitans sp. TaxID=1932789 RepID=UPI002EF8BF82
MTQWGIDTLFNPGKRHMDEEKRRLQSTREEIGDSSGGRRIDLESGTVTIPRRGKGGPADAASESGEAEAGEADTAPEAGEAELDEAELDEAEGNAEPAEAEPNVNEAEPTADEAVAESDAAEAEPKTFGTGAQAAGIDLRH